MFIRFVLFLLFCATFSYNDIAPTNSASLGGQWEADINFQYNTEVSITPLKF